MFSLTTLIVIFALSFFFIGALAKPYFGILGYLTVYLLFNDNSWWYQPIKQYIDRPSFIAMIFLISGCILHLKLLDWKITRKELLFYLFFISSWIASYFSDFGMHEGSFFILEKMTKMCVFLFLFFRAINTWEKFNAVIWLIIFSTFFMAYQAHVSGNISTGRVENIGGIDFMDSNSLAAVLIVGMTFLGFRILEVSNIKKIIFAGALPIMMNTFILTRSRSAFIGIVCALPFMFTKLPKKFKKQVFLFLLAGGVLFFILADPHFLERMGTIDDSIDQQKSGVIMESEDHVDRIDFWRASLYIFKDHPMGIGVNNFPRVVVRYDPRNPGMDAHNTFVLCYSEIGIIGFILFLWIIIESFFELKRTRQYVVGTEYEDKIGLIIKAITASLIIYLLGSSTTHSYLYLEITWILLVLPTCLEKIVKTFVTEKSLASAK